MTLKKIDYIISALIVVTIVFSHLLINYPKAVFVLGLICVMLFLMLFSLYVYNSIFTKLSFSVLAYIVINILCYSFPFEYRPDIQYTSGFADIIIIVLIVSLCTAFAIVYFKNGTRKTTSKDIADYIIVNVIISFLLLICFADNINYAFKQSKPQLCEFEVIEVGIATSGKGELFSVVYCQVSSTQSAVSSIYADEDYELKEGDIITMKCRSGIMYDLYSSNITIVKRAEE